MTKSRLSGLAILLALCLTYGVLSNLSVHPASVRGLGLLVAGGGLVALCYGLAPHLDRLTPSRIRGIVNIGVAVMIIGQLLTLAILPNTVYHDPYRMLSQADQMAHGSNTWTTTYFWRYPNNVPLTYLLSLWFRLTNLFSLSTNTSVHLLSLIVLDGFIIMVMATLAKLTKRPSLVLGSLAFFALSPFAYTYNLQVFYSDLPSIVMMVVIFRQLLFWRDKTRSQKWRSGTLLLLVTLLGQVIRPNQIVLVPALIIVAALLLPKKRWRQVPLLVPVILMLAGFALSVPTTQGIYAASNYHTDQTYQLPINSWILMGMNTHSKGEYSSGDISHAVSQSNKTARQAYNSEMIKQRIAKMGPAGLIKQWLVKLRTLLSVDTIQTWYNGGYRAAPSWYLAHAQFLTAFIAIAYQMATIGLWIAVIWRLVMWRPNLTNTTDVIALLAMTTVLGYLAFHTLVWETESRYGQVILGLLFILLAALPTPPRRPLSHQRWALPTFGLVALLSAVGTAAIIGVRDPETVIVAAQRSQLSTQYHAKPTYIYPGETFSQDVILHGTANDASIQIHQGTIVTATLTNLSTHHVIHLYQSGDSYRLDQPIGPGHYQMTFVNHRTSAQPIDVVKTFHYQLAADPLMINHQSQPTSSLVYKFLDEPK